MNRGRGLAVDVGMEEMPDVDRGAAADLRPCGIALPERPDGRGMGTGRTLHPAGEARRPQAHGGRALSLPRPRGHPVKVRHAALAICSWAWAGVKKPRPECRRRRL